MAVDQDFMTREVHPKISCAKLDVRLDVGLSTTQTGFTPEWSSPRTMLAVVNAWVSSPGVLACGYGGAPDGSQVTQIYKLTTATCTANPAHTGFDCDRAP